MELKHASLFAGIKAWDVRNFYRINGWHGKLASLLKYYTHVGSTPFWVVVLVGLFVFSWISGSTVGWAFWRYAVSNTTSIAVVLLIKIKINRKRPCEVLENVVVRTPPRFYRGSSFPSGHVQYFFSNLLLLSMVLSWNLAYAWTWMLPITFFLSAVIALSRVYVGVHYPTDVLASFVSGFLIYLLTLFVTFPLWNLVFTALRGFFQAPG
ncbi:MAG TPA: phosphatase PAP2 family protein [Candidatus Lokiarchaeia archaeon]|nr:phosphatase PAP2 family protein [Candidatus Lokiarchaeia archaeon]